MSNRAINIAFWCVNKDGASFCLGSVMKHVFNYDTVYQESISLHIKILGF